MLTYIVWNSSKETMYRSLREDILDASKKSGIITADGDCRFFFCP
jgi:hypothetical protein